MRLITFDGNKYELSERNWKQMLKRFDYSRASLNSLGYYLIPVKSICVTRSYKCIRCPLRDPRKKINSCTFLFSKILGEDLLRCVHLRDSGVLWDAKNTAATKLALQKVTNVLIGALHFSRRGQIQPKQESRQSLV